MLTTTLLLFAPTAFPQHLGKPKTVRLKESTLESHHLIPLAVEHEIGEHLPLELVGVERGVQVRRKDLRIDTDGDGRFDLTVSSKKSKVVEISVGKSAGKVRKKLLVYRKDGHWMASSSALLAAKIEKQGIELLDANLDGDFGGLNDWLRWSGGCFYRQNESRLLPTKDGLVRYEVLNDAKKPNLTYEKLPRPDGVNDLQWDTLLAVNHHRNAGGFAPWTLDLNRSAACQKHAEYLYLNKYDYGKPWDGVGSHSEIPGNPGFSEEGLAAAKNSSTGSYSDPTRAVNNQIRTMLHRLGYLGPAGESFAVGAVDRTHTDVGSGYSVLWGAKPVVSTLRNLVVYPGPGQVLNSLEVRHERPPVERDPLFYERPRGYPVSVSFGDLSLQNVRLALFDEKTGKVIPGELFTPEQPIHSTRPQNSKTAFFVADKRLSKNSTYRAEFEAHLNEESVRIVWWFKT